MDRYPTYGRSEWYAIQTRTGAEAVGRSTVASLQLDTLLPLRRTPCRSHGRQREEIRPLFPGYFFAQFRPATHLHLVRYSRGVVRVVGTTETPWPVDDILIDDLRFRLGPDGVAVVEPSPWQAGERVTVTRGPLEGWQGVFERELDDRQRVVILLESIQQARMVVDRDCLARAGAL